MKLSGSAETSKHKILALRGYVRLAKTIRDHKDRDVMYLDALPLAERPEELRLILGGLGDSRSHQSLQAVTKYLDHENVAEEAAATAIRIAWRVEKKHDELAREVAEKVAAVSKNKRTLGQAKDLLKAVKK